ncbi:hypothetical protein ACQI4L_02880 [Mycolicibacterium litorale]
MVYRASELGAVVYYVGGNVLEITPPVLAEGEAAGNDEEVAKYAGW